MQQMGHIFSLAIVSFLFIKHTNYSQVPSCSHGKWWSNHVDFSDFRPIKSQSSPMVITTLWLWIFWGRWRNAAVRWVSSLDRMWSPSSPVPNRDSSLPVFAWLGLILVELVSLQVSEHQTTIPTKRIVTAFYVILRVSFDSSRLIFL